MVCDQRFFGRSRCRQHRVTEEFYVPQLQRLLRGQTRDQLVYYSLIDDVVGSDNPLELFEGSKRRPGMYLIEALYRTHAELVDDGEQLGEPALAPLGYARWVAWRRFADDVRSGSVSFPRGLGEFIGRSKRDVESHLNAGWVPAVVPRDPELIELLDHR